MQILEKQLTGWTSTYYDQSLMSRERLGSHRYDHVGELNSEDTRRIYNHTRQRRNLILLEKTKYMRRHSPHIQIVCVQIDEFLVGKTGIICIGKGRTIGLNMTSGDH